MGEVAGAAGHAAVDRLVQCGRGIGAGVDQTTKIAVREDPTHLPCLIHENDRARAALASRGRKRVSDRSVVAHHGKIVTDPESKHVDHRAKTCTEHAAGMMSMKIVRGEITSSGQSEGERIADRHHHGGRHRGGEIHRARFRDPSQWNVDGCRSRQRGARHVGDRDHRDLVRLEDVREAHQFFRLSAEGEQKHHITSSQSAQITVDGLRGMNEVAGLSKARKCGGDLASDEA